MKIINFYLNGFHFNYSEFISILILFNVLQFVLFLQIVMFVLCTINNLLIDTRNKIKSNNPKS